MYFNEELVWNSFINKCYVWKFVVFICYSFMVIIIGYDLYMVVNRFCVKIEDRWGVFEGWGGGGGGVGDGVIFYYRNKEVKIVKIYYRKFLYI